MKDLGKLAIESVRDRCSNTLLICKRVQKLIDRGNVTIAECEQSFTSWEWQNTIPKLSTEALLHIAEIQSEKHLVTLRPAESEEEMMFTALLPELIKRLRAFRAIVERSEILEMHPHCTPNGGCPIAEFRREYEKIAQGFDK